MADAVREGTTTGGVPMPPWVVVPSAVVGEWLQVGAARTAGVSMGVRFVTMAEFYGALGGLGPAERALGVAMRAWTPEALRWRLLPEVDGVAASLGFSSSGAIAPRDRFAAACLLASELDRTLRLRPAWARLWRNHQPALPSPNPAEDWQRRLWCKIADSVEMPPHPAELVSTREEGLGRAPTEARPQVFFVAAAELEPLALQTLRWLTARGWVVELHVLLPSVGYLGDLPSRRARRARLAGGSEAEVGAGEAASPGGGHPLLISLGQQAAGVFWQLGDLDNDYSAWPEAGADVAFSTSGTSVLTRLQAAVRGGVESVEAVASPDESLRVHECHGVRRELEILRDELLRAFRDLPGLKPEEVRVAVVDYDAYAPLAEAVLRRPAPGLPYGIPVRLTAVAAREANPVLVALLAWLRLAGGRQAASEFLELLALEAVKQRLGVADDAEAQARLVERVRSSGLTHGLGESDGAEEGAWPAARDRLAAGFWFGPREAGVRLPPIREEAGRDGGDGETHWVFPVASVLADDEAGALRLADWWWTLEQCLREAQVPVPASVWAKRLRVVVEGLLRCDAMEEPAVACLRWVAELEEVAALDVLDVGAVTDWLAPRLDNATSLRTSLDGSVLLGRLEQVRGLPCRVLAILGLQDEAFPRAERRPAWSLPALRPERSDPEARRRDRQLFLDLVLTPTVRLVLTAANRNRRTQHDGPLSACVEDLLRAVAFAAGGAAPDRWRIRHALQPFAPGYFQLAPDGGGSELPPSFDEAAAGTAARMAEESRAAATPFFPGDAAGPAMPEVGSDHGAEVHLSLATLIAFWRNPARGWLRALGVAAAEEEHDDEALDDAPIELDGLQNHQVTDVILRSKLGLEADPESARARLAADRGLAPGALGRLRWQSAETELQELTGVLPGCVREARAEAFELSLLLDAAGAGTAVRCHLRGEAAVLPVEPGEPGPRLLVYRAGKYSQEAHARHRLAAWIPMLAFAAARGRPTGGLICGTEVEAGRVVKRAGFVGPERAGALLARLVRGFWVGQRRPLPFAPETSATLAKVLAQSGGDQAAALDAAEEVWSRSGAGGLEGEGLEDAAQLAWRDRDPFNGEAGREWLEWAEAIAVPLADWWAGVDTATAGADQNITGPGDREP